MSFDELSLESSLLTAQVPYDVFVFDQGGAAALEAKAWSSSSSRGTGIGTAELGKQDGVLVLLADRTRRYVGTVWPTVTTGTVLHDRESMRHVFNAYNQVPRRFLCHPGANDNAATTTYTVTGTSWNRVNAGVGASMSFVLGLRQDVIYTLVGMIDAPDGGAVYIGVGVDSTTAAHALVGLLATQKTRGSSATRRFSLEPGGHFLHVLGRTTAGVATVYADGTHPGGGDIPATYLTGQVLA